ncbi:TonB-dependent receptor plug domain-containing protein [Puia sp. P3]|uniref:TonB-dependent receptor plug domain-containing protein n=1 Tax=Puia sp. P3 TaxID=3423952 RepID=UPI003D67D9B0
MRKFHCVLWLLLFHWCQASAQSRQVYGKVLDAADKSPLSGVTVNARGSRTTVVSGPDGSFSLRVSPKTTTLNISYIGYDDQQLTLSAENEPLTILLSSSQKALNEVVVVGYGKAAKRDITGSVSKLDAKAVENYPAPSFESALQGKAPGVVVQSGSGKLGQAIQINIRGISSISASSQPLFVVDGLPVTTATMSDGNNEPTNPLTDINPNDIESVDILKDASASAIYGARAANGVVLITTKKERTAAGRSSSSIQLPASATPPENDGSSTPVNTSHSPDRRRRQTAPTTSTTKSPAFHPPTRPSNGTGQMTTNMCTITFHWVPTGRMPPSIRTGRPRAFTGMLLPIRSIFPQAAAATKPVSLSQDSIISRTQL